jgi:quinol-cytochrome oxidoreductase complex cytochrome b subunit
MTEERQSIYSRLIDWFDSRVGFKKTMLRPIPEYGMNPIYWFGMFMALSFVMQGLTGLFQLLYYVPLPDQAYSSTTNIIKNVPLGQLVETFHLYNAYAMIFLAFLHLTRNYFGSVHKRPRELMWVVGVLLGLITLGFGLTGYLLPWTVVSKSATDVAVGMLGLLPTQLGSVAKFMVVGSGSDDSILRRFLFIHTVLLPTALLALLALKVYMYEIHGPAFVRAYGKGKARIFPWFPSTFDSSGVIQYALIFCSVYLALVLTVSALFPLVLPPEFTPQAAASYVAQPDWYFLWLYQILKFSFFEGSGIYYAVGGITVFMLLLLLLPFYDRGTERKLGSRPHFVTIGTIIVAELLTLTVWGYLTPGQEIPALGAIMTTGGVAVIITIASYLAYTRRKKLEAARVSSPPAAS